MQRTIFHHFVKLIVAGSKNSTIPLLTVEVIYIFFFFFSAVSLEVLVEWLPETEAPLACLRYHISFDCYPSRFGGPHGEVHIVIMHPTLFYSLSHSSTYAFSQCAFSWPPQSIRILHFIRKRFDNISSKRTKYSILQLSPCVLNQNKYNHQKSCREWVFNLSSIKTIHELQISFLLLNNSFMF